MSGSLCDAADWNDSVLDDGLHRSCYKIQDRSAAVSEWTDDLFNRFLMITLQNSLI